MAHETYCTCGVTGISYSFPNKEGLLFAAANGCYTDESCIDIFLNIDPTVMLVHIFVDGRSDKVCVRKNDSWSFINTETSQPFFPTEWSEVRH